MKYLLGCLLVIVVVSALPTPNNNFVPLKSVQSRREALIRSKQFDAVKQLNEKVRNRPYMKNAFYGDQKPGYQPEEDYQDLLYMAEVTIGTPGQKFAIILDTGSSNLWIPDVQCSGGGCENKHKFTSSASSTYNADGRRFEIQYGTGSASGVIGVDKFCFGNTSFCVDRQGFGQATQVASFFARQPIDGICGMAFRSIAVDGIIPPFIQLQDQLPQPYFTVWMTADGGAVHGQPGGGVTYGGLDTQHCDAQVDWHRLTSDTYFQINLDSVAAKGMKHDGGSAIVDTGTSLITGPKRSVDALCQSVGGQFNSQVGLYTVPCAGDGPAMTFTINGKDYTVEKKNYAIDLGVGGGQCVIGVQGTGFSFGGPDWILGDVFIRQYCSLFDTKNMRVGLAKALM